MLYVYGALMPLRLLEEIRFWKVQEKEHTVVIREIAPNNEPEYAKLLQEWEPLFAETEWRANQWIESIVRSPHGITPYVAGQAQALLIASMEQSRLFIEQLRLMMKQSSAIRNNPVAVTVIAHIIRESEYFLGVLNAFLGEEIAIGAAHYAILPERQREESWLHYRGHSKPTLDDDLAEPSSVDVGRHDDRPAYSSLETSGSQTGLTAAAEGTWSQPPVPDQHPVPVGGHTLPPLPYAYDALEPYIDAETMKLHHDKLHLNYVGGLNKAERMLQQARESGDFDLIKYWEKELAFNGAGHYLHTIFWNVMSPRGGGKATALVAPEIDRSFGSYKAFKTQFSAAAEKVEGGGWAILVWSPRSHRLEILQAEKHQNLSQWDVIPLLVLDVWEHSYYLKYQTDRAKYIEAWWNLVHWQHVNERFVQARKVKWHPY